VEFECTKALTEICSVMGKKYGPFKVGNIYKMEFFVGKIFVINGYMKRKDEIDVKMIEKYSFQESSNQDILKLSNNTFLKMQSEIELAKQLLDMGKMPIYSYRLLKSKMYDFFRVRLNKILKFASVTQSQGRGKIISEEEEIMFKNISDAIENFRTFFEENENP
jgi:hypothetical protein